MVSTSRGRLTPVDVVLFGVALFVLGNLVGPMYTVMNDNAGSMSKGTALLFQLLVPGMIMTILVVVYVTGATGGGQ